MTTATTSDSGAKKDTQKLQRSIVDGLEDVKAQDIQVFNTEHLSPLFERVIVASGTSNRQTRALAASVRDAVREAGFSKPRIEGEENGEWIIVDCGPAVVHIMQPAIRQYYHLEELWGEKPVRLKFGAAKPATPAAPVEKPAPAGKKAAGKSNGKASPGRASPGRAASGKSAPARSAASGRAAPARSEPPRAAPAKSAGSRAAAGAPAAKKAAPATTGARKTAPSSTPAKKPAAKKAAPKR